MLGYMAIIWVGNMSVSESRKHIPKWRLWTLIGIYISILVVLGNLLLHPPVSKIKVDCHKAMALWNQYEGQAAISAFSGQDNKAKFLRKDYDRLVLYNAPSCFPKDLKDYIIQNP